VLGATQNGTAPVRARAILGGAVILGGIVLWQRPSLDQDNAGSNPFGCASTNDGSVCDAVAGISKVIHSPLIPAKLAALHPPPETPGAVDPAITQANIDETICRPGYARSVRPAYLITGLLKRRMMDAQHPGERMADYELDHLIPISIGGAPLDMHDLWLQPRQGQANAGDKNVLAYVLWRLVCTHQVPLQTAQRDISHDWTRAYVVELLQYSRGRQNGAVPDSAGSIGAAHLALTVKDIHTAIARVEAAGWKAKGSPLPIAGGPRKGTLVAYVSGPDHITIELMQPPAR
jgi:hypothetical protein